MIEAITSVSSTIIRAASYGDGMGIGILSYLTDGWGEDRYRTYTALSGVADDFATTTPEYLAARAIFSQSPRPRQIAILRGDNAPTQRFAVAIKTVTSSTDYSIRVRTETATYTSDASATRAEIVAGLVSALEALDGAGDYVASSQGSGADEYVRILHGTAGGWLDVEILTPSLLSIAQDHAAPDVAADLDAISEAGAPFYYLLTSYNSAAYVAAVAAWTETSARFYLAETQDSSTEDTAIGSATDPATANRAAERDRTIVVYHHNPGQQFAAALVGRCSTIPVGGGKWAIKRLSGPTYRTKTSTQLTNLEAKNAGYYALYGIGSGSSRTLKTGSDVWVEDRVGVDDCAAAMVRASDARIAQRDPPLSDAGLATVGGDLRGVLESYADAGLFLLGSPVVNIPRRSDLTDQQIATRSASYRWSALVAGYIQAVTATGEVAAA